MLQDGGNSYTDCRSSLLNVMTVSRERYEHGKKNEESRVSYEKEIIDLEIQIEELRACGNHLRDMYSNIKSYSIARREEVRNLLNNSLEKAGELVPDADAKGIHLKTTENNRTIVVNGENQSVNLREGGGYRGILGALINFSAIRAQPDALPLMLFDEYFFTLSDTTTGNFKDVLEDMKKYVTIICIEQRRNVTDGLVDREFTFVKGLDKNTVVTQTM